MSPKLEKCPSQLVCGAEALLCDGTHGVPPELPRGLSLEPQGQGQKAPEFQRLCSAAGERSPTREGSTHSNRGNRGSDPADAPLAFAAVGRPSVPGEAGQTSLGALASWVPGRGSEGHEPHSGFELRGLGFPVCEPGGDPRLPLCGECLQHPSPENTSNPNTENKEAGTMGRKLGTDKCYAGCRVTPAAAPGRRVHLSGL